MIGKRVLTGVLAATLILACPGLTAYGEEGQEAPAVEGEQPPAPEKTPEELAAEEEARKNAIYEMIPDSNHLPGWPEGPKVHAASAVVIDMESGAVLYAKSAEEQHFPASITKLMTTLVALETGEPDDIVTFTEDSISFLEPGDASIGMQAGEQLSLNDALRAVLLASANEVSYAVAENMGIKMGGTYQTFIDRMNERAMELGCTGSHWVNANGLHDDQHFTTAHDMARIAAAVYQYEPFQHFMGALEYTIGPTNLVDEPRTCWQNHKMLWPENEYYYELCRGGKTGYTDQSGTTLVTMADNGQMRLAAVVMADYGVQAYEDTRAMLDYAFGNFTKVTIADKETSSDIEAFQDEGAYVVLPADVDFTQLECQISAAEGSAETGNHSFDRWIEVLTAAPAPTDETTAEGTEGDPAEEAQPNAEETQSGQEDAVEASTDEAQPGMEEGTDRNTEDFAGNERAGTIIYTYAGQEAGHAAVVLTKSYFKHEPDAEWRPADGSRRKSEEDGKKTAGRFTGRQLIMAGAAVAILIIILYIYNVRRKRNQKRKRRNRKNEKPLD